MIYLTDTLTDEKIERSILGQNLKTSRDELINPLSIKVLLVWHTAIDMAFLKRFPNVHSVVRYGVGYDKIDLNDCKALSIKVFNNPDYGVDEVSDTAVAMLLSLARGIHRYDYLSRKELLTVENGVWQKNVDKTTKRLAESTLGVIGLGRIGTAVARKMSGIVKEVCFFDPYVPSGYEKATRTRRMESIIQLLECSDLVSLHVPLTAETTGMVDRSFLDKMKNASILVNTARGKLLANLNDLDHALARGKLAGLGLDVLPEEPPQIISRDCFITNWLKQTNVYRGRVIINPHTSFYSAESIIEMRKNASRTALNALHDRQIRNRVV